MQRHNMPPPASAAHHASAPHPPASAAAAPGSTDDDSQALHIAVSLRFGASFALAADLRLPGQGVTALFGPSGCGKTTLLRTVAGLARPSPGRIAVGGHIWQDDARGIWLPTHRRPLGMVFQEASLFPHLSVQANLDFGRRRVPESQRRIALDQAIELLGIGPLLARQPGQLSGGERQRVAIARALAASPRLLLMDEPLAALDAARKAELLPYFERLHRELALPILYVSHALDEVARLATHVVLMERGRVLAHGSVGHMLTRPDLPLAHGDNASAVLQGTLVSADPAYGLLQVRLQHTRPAPPSGSHEGGSGGANGAPVIIQCAPESGGSALAQPPGQPMRLRIMARDVSLTLAPPAASSVLNVLPARILHLADEPPAHTLVTLDLAGQHLLARITRKSAHTLHLAPGQPVHAQIKGVAVLG